MIPDDWTQSRIKSHSQGAPIFEDLIFNQFNFLFLPSLEFYIHFLILNRKHDLERTKHKKIWLCLTIEGENNVRMTGV